MPKERLPTSEELDEAYTLNKAVSDGDITLAYAENADQERIDDVVTGMSKLNREEFARLSQEYPGFERDPRFKIYLVETLIYNVMKKLYPYSDFKEEDRSWVLDEIAAVGIIDHITRKGKEWSEPISLEKVVGKLKSKEVLLAKSIEDELVGLGDYEKILLWCKEHKPPVRITLWDRGYIKLCALRGYVSDLKKSMRDATPKKVQ